MLLLWLLETLHSSVDGYILLTSGLPVYFALDVTGFEKCTFTIVYLNTDSDNELFTIDLVDHLIASNPESLPFTISALRPVYSNETQLLDPIRDCKPRRYSTPGCFTPDLLHPGVPGVLPRTKKLREIEIDNAK